MIDINAEIIIIYVLGVVVWNVTMHCATEKYYLLSLTQEDTLNLKFYLHDHLADTLPNSPTGKAIFF